MNIKYTYSTNVCIRNSYTRVLNQHETLSPVNLVCFLNFYASRVKSWHGCHMGGLAKVTGLFFYKTAYPKRDITLRDVSASNNCTLPSPPCNCASTAISGPASL
jgi:hypothetical protein